MSDQAVYYIMNVATMERDSVAVWWCPNGQGYTYEIEKAGLYTAKYVKDNRLTDIAVHRDAVVRTRHVLRIDDVVDSCAKVREQINAVHRANMEAEECKHDICTSELESWVRYGDSPFEGDEEHGLPRGVQLIRDTIVKAAKPHTCHKCGDERIRKGQYHRCRVESCEGKATQYRWCHECSGQMMGYPYAGAPELDTR